MNLFHAQFPTGQVTAAADVPNSSLQTWLKRQLIIGHPERPISGGGNPGHHRRFSFFNVMELAVAKALTEAGLSDLPLAFKAASHFAHTGEGPIGNQPGREPGLPYFMPNTSGCTLLCVAGDKSCIVPWVVGTDPLPSIRIELGKPTGFVLLEIDPLFDRVVTRLGYHPSEVMDLAYGDRETP